jgi:hypothetical protein
MQALPQLPCPPQLKRKIYIVFYDTKLCYKNVNFTKTSGQIKPRNFLSKDETLIDYDLESDEEWELLNGEESLSKIDDENADEEEEDEEDYYD